MITFHVLDDFYNKIRNKSLLILVSCDVDSVCSAKIFLELLQSDHIQYTIIPVRDKENLLNVYHEHKHFKNVVMLNCGSNFDVIEYLNPPPNTRFYIIDNHRPIDIYNIYNAEQIIVIVDEDEQHNFPDFKDIFYNQSDDSDLSDQDNNEDIEDSSETTIEKQNPILRGMKRQKRKLRHEERRQKILFEYTEYSYWANPSCLILFTMAWILSRDTNAILWCTILGFTDHYVKRCLQFERYMEAMVKLKNHVYRLNKKDAVENQNKERTVIKVINELNLVLYRHWTLFESLWYSYSTACQFRIWSTRGQRRLNEFLADIGIPLSQSQQKFQCMELDYRKNVKTWIEQFAEKYGLEEMNFPSFTISFGYNKTFGAMDFTLALSAILEQNITNDATKGKTQNSDSTQVVIPTTFFAALDCLQHSLHHGAGFTICKNDIFPISYTPNSKNILGPTCNDTTEFSKEGKNFAELYRGIELAKIHAKTIFDTTQAILDDHQIITVGPFLYATLSEQLSSAHMFDNPILLKRLAHFILIAYNAKHGLSNKKLKHLPLTLCVPIIQSYKNRKKEQNSNSQSNIPQNARHPAIHSTNAPENSDISIIGLPPLSILESTNKNFLGKAFEQAAQNMHAHTFRLKGFDPTIISMGDREKGRFMDALVTMLD